MYVIILSIWSVPWMNEALKLHPNDVNMTAMEARLDGMDHELSQEKIQRKDLEKKLENSTKILENSTKILENTVFLLQQEKNMRQNLESKLDDTINLLQNTSVALQMEENRRKKVRTETWEQNYNIKKHHERTSKGHQLQC